MNNLQESKYSMELCVEDFFLSNDSVTAILPGFGPLLTLFSNNVEQIQVIREQQETDKSGIKDNKDLLRDDLVAKAYNVGIKTSVFAKMNNLHILAKEVHFTKSALEGAADDKLKGFALIIHHKASSQINDLGDYGVTEAMLADLQTAIDLFGGAIHTPRIGVIETKKYTGRLALLLKDNDELLKKFDLLVKLTETSNPEFYTAYKDNRKVINTGKGSIALNALITNGTIGIGLKGVTATFVLQNNTLKSDFKPIIKTTAPKGRFIIKNLPDGIYNVTLSKTGYKEKVIQIVVAHGDRTILKAEMEAI